jgi:hypothetical protein
LLSEEGAAFKSFKLISEGKFREEELVAALTGAGTRNLHDNLADLHAQIAANHKVNIEFKCVIQVLWIHFDFCSKGNWPYPRARICLWFGRRSSVYGTYSEQCGVCS